MPTDPTPEAMEKARGLATAWYHGCGFPCDGNDLPALEAAIARAIDEARKVPEGYVREGVTDRKVLGTLPLTVEGDVIGDGAYCWFMLPGVKGRDDDKPARVMYKPMPIVEPDAYGGSRKVHSTREAAAEAARKGGE